MVDRIGHATGDPNNHIWKWEWDALHRLKKRTAPPAINGGSTRSVQAIYNAGGQVTKLIAPDGRETHGVSSD
jgi:YD repeat-containing protein